MKIASQKKFSEKNICSQSPQLMYFNILHLNFGFDSSEEA